LMDFSLPLGSKRPGDVYETLCIKYKNRKPSH
jgi:hypothetical protein